MWRLQAAEMRAFSSAGSGLNLTHPPARLGINLSQMRRRQLSIVSGRPGLLKVWMILGVGKRISSTAAAKILDF
jgi:hypothetical protein